MTERIQTRNVHIYNTGDIHLAAATNYASMTDNSNLAGNKVYASLIRIRSKKKTETETHQLRAYYERERGCCSQQGNEVEEVTGEEDGWTWM